MNDKLFPQISICGYETQPSPKINKTKPSEALLKSGSDKVTTHSYGELYDALLIPANVKKILEIGIYQGASIRAWLECLPEASVYGIDVYPYKHEPQSNRCLIAQGDAVDPNTILEIFNKWRIEKPSIDIIIDDGSHSFRDQLTSFLLLWKYVSPGGWYVIEDVDPKTPKQPFVDHGGIVLDLTSVKNRYDDVMILFNKPKKWD